MNIILDLIPLKAGGGQQVGINLIEELEKNEGFGHNWLLLVTKNTIFDRKYESEALSIVARIDNSLTKRLKYEYFGIKKTIDNENADLLYTQFGPGFPKQKIPTIVGSAYSNLYFTEIKFWNNWPIYFRILYKFRDHFRIQRTLNADGWIFETELITEQARKIFNLPKRRTITIKPSIANSFSNSKITSDFITRLSKIPHGFRILLLTGWHKNKNIDMLPEIARELRKLNTEKVFFVISVSASHPFSKEIIKEAKKYGVENQLVFFDRVEANECVNLYKEVNAVMLLSLLESFSNNMIESWATNRPLIITDDQWSRAICGKSGVYVDRSNPKDIAIKIKNLIEDKNYYNLIINEGNSVLKNYPDYKEKTLITIKFIEKIIKLGKIK